METRGSTNASETNWPSGAGSTPTPLAQNFYSPPDCFVIYDGVSRSEVSEEKRLTNPKKVLKCTLSA